MAERGVDTVVMEVSSHALALGRVDGIHFAVSGFTNLSRDHLDFHPTMEDYFDAKARLFDPDSPLRARRVVVCVDDEAGRAMAAGPATRSPSAPRVSQRIGAPSTWPRWAPRATVHRRRSRRRSAPVGVPLPGHYNVANCLVALALLDAVGVSPERAAPGLRQTRVPGRMEKIDAGQDFLALVDYAHKPGALRAVLTTLNRPGRPAGGGVRRRRRTRPGQTRADGRVAAELADLVVVTDDNPRSEDPATIRREILAGATESGVPRGCRGRRPARAIRHAVAWAGPGDVVLIAGKGHETGQRAADTPSPFDDRVELAGAALDGRTQ